jgi:hypothetical protein
LSFVFNLKTQLALRFREKSLIIRLKIVVVITCHWCLCIGGRVTSSFLGLKSGSLFDMILVVYSEFKVKLRGDLMKQRAGILKRTAIISFTAMVLFGQVCLAKYSGGAGTSGDPYKIATAADLLALAANTGDYNKCFVLTADIDLGSHGTFTRAVIAWDIDNSNAYFDGYTFSGVFDGAGHKISNLTINTNGARCDCLGLFGYNGWNGQIKNLGLQNVKIIAGAQSQRISALVGENNQGNITNCFSTGTIVVADNAWAVGGIVGIHSQGNVNSCYSTVAITGGESVSDLGGLVGEVSYEGTITDCCAMGNVSSGNDSWYLGGLVGFNTGDIVRCYATGDIAGGDEVYYFGGLVGANWDANIVNCFSTGNVTGGYKSYSFGGLAGGNQYEANIINCFSTGNVTGGDSSSHIGGLVGENDAMTGSFAVISNCYSAGIVKSGGSSLLMGGLLGYNYNGSINHCHFLSGSGSNNGYGEPLTYAQMKQQANFIGWDFTNIWKIDEGISYPKLIWQPDCIAPSAPAGVSASDGAYNNKVHVTWNSVSGSTRYEIWRNTSNSAGSASMLGEFTYYFDDSSVTPGVTYYYWVKAKSSCGTSGFSSSDSGYATTIPLSDYVSVAKCTVTAGKKENSDKISFSGTMNPTSVDLYLTNYIQIFIDSGDMHSPCVVMIPTGNKDYSQIGKLTYSGTENGVKKSFKLDLKTHNFVCTAQNIDLSGLSCPLNIQVVISEFGAEAEVNERIVNGPKKPIPINLLMGVNNSLRVDKSKFTRDKKTGNITQVAVSGGFSVKETGMDMTANSFSVTIGSQTFTIPAGKFVPSKGKFTCSKVALSGGEIAAATFDFNKCTFTLTIKGTKITDTAGSADFKVEFGEFSEGAEVSLP